MTAPEQLAGALVAALDDQALAELARRLVRFLPAPAEPDAGGWLDARAAAAHLGLPVAQLHRLTGERALPFSQERPGAKCYFRRADLDAYREQHMHGQSPL